ncbi:MATE family efflux transporter [Treponema primitia]|uniref:MATE family efflux transporter n=1 Tax=Treponema primitia TaxID=88058 RepID=UPI000255507B|nr:MATE family efflux transporter [Treponema primitia]
MENFKGSFDLTEGSIVKKIILVAAPIMGTQFLQMAYNLTDMFWLGRLGSFSVAASGAAGMYMWLSMGFLLIGRMGAEIGVAQSLGRGDKNGAIDFLRNALLINFLLGVFCGGAFIFIPKLLASFFPIGEAVVLDDAAAYLRIVGFGIIPAFISGVLSGAFNAAGNSRVPFVINSIGLACNVVLDPLCILTLGLGIRGAAYATIFAQSLVCVLMLIAIKRFKSRPFDTFRFRFKPDRKKIARILKWSVPIGLESLFFCFLSMLSQRIEARFGPAVFAVGKIGSQIESLSWLIGGGFGSALVAFVGQNYGAGKTERIARAVKLSLGMMAAWGTLIVVFFLTAGKYAFLLFLPNPEIAELGKQYLWIFAVAQIPMNIEAVLSGTFKGKGKTIPPSVVSIASNVMKPVLAFTLSRSSLGIYGAWAGVAAGDVLRCAGLFIWYRISEATGRRKAFP